MFHFFHKWKWEFSFDYSINHWNFLTSYSYIFLFLDLLGTHVTYERLLFVQTLFTSYVYLLQNNQFHQGAKIQNILGKLCFEYLLSAEFLTLVYQGGQRDQIQLLINKVHQNPFTKKVSNFAHKCPN